MIHPFHLAFPVHDLQLAREFYAGVLGCGEGRSSKQWIDFNLYGHQVVAHLAPDECEGAQRNQVDGKSVPVRHFGIVLSWDKWHELKDHLEKKRISFLIEPYIRFQGLPGEQATLFISDPSGNALEFKSFRNMDQLFAK